MKYSVILATAFVAAVTAQDLSGIPPCAVKCITDAVASATSCAATDVACICSHKKDVVDAATGCVLGACGLDVAVGQVLPATDDLCPASGDNDDSDNGDDTPEEPTVTLTPTATAEEPDEEPTVTDTPTVSSAVGGSVVTKPVPSLTTSCTTITLAPSASLSPSPPANGTISTKPPVPVVTAGAAAFGAVGSFGLMVLGAAMAL